MSAASSWTNLERFVPERIKRSAWMRPKYPLTSVELREDAVVAVRLREKKGYHLAGHGHHSLDPGAFNASLISDGQIDAVQLGNAIGGALRMAGAENANNISLTIPDTAARAFMLDFQELPASTEQALNVIRWRLKKSVPFPLEDAQISWEELGRMEDGRVHLLVVVSPTERIQRIERVFEDLGIRVGLVDLASFDVFNALRLAGTFQETSNEDVGLISATPTYFSVMVLRGGRLIFYRSKNYHLHGSFQGEESLRVVGRELRTTLSYYEEHLLGEGIGRLYARIVGVDSGGMLDVVRQTPMGDAEPMNIASLLPEMSGVSEDMSSELIPAIGVALRRES